MHRESNGSTIGPAPHAACGLAGLAVAVLTLAVGWSVVVAATAWMPALSTTALVVLAAFVWGLTWLGLETALALARRRGGPVG